MRAFLADFAPRLWSPCARVWERRVPGAWNILAAAHAGLLQPTTIHLVPFEGERLGQVVIARGRAHVRFWTRGPRAAAQVVEATIETACFDDLMRQVGSVEEALWIRV
jgi:hypothetical protein